ncbi:hypothetical protein ACJBU6_09688 [Exserohilum turcicum]
MRQEEAHTGHHTTRNLITQNARGQNPETQQSHRPLLDAAPAAAEAYGAPSEQLRASLCNLNTIRIHAMLFSSHSFSRNSFSILSVTHDRRFSTLSFIPSSAATW